MEVLLFVVFVSLTSAFSYHKDVGIPTAESIRQAEIGHYNNRIVNGSYVSPGAHPYFAGLLISLDNVFLTSVCGSTLIKNTKLVTAAHCAYDGVDRARLVQVVLGSTTLFRGGKRINTDQITMHKEFNPITVANDIAIITIPRVTFNDNIKAISLPEDSSNRFVNVLSQVVGYGITSDTTDIETGQRLSYADVTVRPDSHCLKFGWTFTTSMLCTEGSDGGPCRGDSGGPLLYRNSEQKDVLIGIVSFGSPNCAAGFPAVYTRVTSYDNWINKNI